jgi:hypothetical protein
MSKQIHSENETIRVCEFMVKVAGIPHGDDNFDYAAVADELRAALDSFLPEGQVGLVVAREYSNLSNQGYLNMKGRVFGEKEEKKVAAKVKKEKIGRTGHDGKPVLASNCVAPIGE